MLNTLEELGKLPFTEHYEWLFKNGLVDKTTDGAYWYYDRYGVIRVLNNSNNGYAVGEAISRRRFEPFLDSYIKGLNNKARWTVKQLPINADYDYKLTSVEPGFEGEQYTEYIELKGREGADRNGNPYDLEYFKTKPIEVDFTKCEKPGVYDEVLVATITADDKHCVFHKLNGYFKVEPVTGYASTYENDGRLVNKLRAYYNLKDAVAILERNEDGTEIKYLNPEDYVCEP